MNSQTQVLAPAKTTSAPMPMWIPKPPMAVSDHAQETPDVETHLDNVARLGHSFGQIGIHHGAPPVIQPKLTVGPAHDQYEQEADRVARQVVERINAPAAQRQEMPEEEEEVQAKPLVSSLQRQEMPEEEEEKLQTKPLTDSLQRQEKPEEEQVQTKLLASSIQRQELPEEEEKLQTSPLTGSLQRQKMPEEEELQTKTLPDLVQRQELPEEEEDIQTKQLQRQEMPEEEAEKLQTKPPANALPWQDEPVQMKSLFQRRADGSMAATPALESAIQQSRGSGQPLPDDARQPMERAFGADFGRVKVHTDGQADQLNRSIQARAFTAGQDIFFRQGEHSPGTRAGQELLAHELTHVVQQNGKVIPFIQRWELEGPWNYGEAVHERLTAQALKAAKIIGFSDTYTSKEAWEYTRGALWNDDPEGLLFDDRDWRRLWSRSTTKYSSGAAFLSKFKRGEKEAKKGTQLGPQEASLLKRSHFGDLQFLHGMAVQGEKAAKTRANMLKWAEFTYKVGVGQIPSNTILADVGINGIPELFPALEKGTTVAMLFCIQPNWGKMADAKKRAIGSLLHMVQDTFAASHTEREYETKHNKGETPKEKVGKIKGFLSYTGQEKAKHSEKDVSKGYSRQEWSAREASAVDAGEKILLLAKRNVPWSDVKPKIEFILGLVKQPKAARPGKEFEADITSKEKGLPKGKIRQQEKTASSLIEPPWISIAKAEIGIKEIKGKKHNPRVVEYLQTTGKWWSTDETPWCSGFVNWVMKQSGVAGTSSAKAISWLTWGRKVEKPAYGAVGVISYGGGKGHVGFVVGKQGDNILLLGGNQSDQVEISSFARGKFSAFVVPSEYVIPSSALELEESDRSHGKEAAFESTR